MSDQTILLKITDGSREGWRVMALDEFLQRIHLDEWNATRRLVGMILPPVRRSEREAGRSTAEVFRRQGG